MKTFLKIAAVIALLALLALGVGFLILLKPVRDARLRIEAIVDRGYVITPEQAGLIARQQSADPEIAAILERLKVRTSDADSEFRGLEWTGRDIAIPLDEDELKWIPMQLAAAGPDLDVAVAAFRKDVVFPVNHQPGVYLTPVPHLLACREFAKVLHRRALLAIQQGRIHDALADSETIMSVARSTRGDGLLVSALVGVGCESLAREVLVEAIARVRVGPGKDEIPPELAKRWIAIALDDRPGYDAFIRGIKIEIGSEREAAKITREHATNSKARESVIATAGRVEWLAQQVDQITEMIASKPMHPGNEHSMTRYVVDNVANWRLVATALAVRLY